MRKSIIIGAAVAASLAVAGTAQADTVTTNFDGPELVNGTPGPDWINGPVNGQYGWTAGGQYDQRVVGVPGDRAIRISNEVTDGSFADMPYSKPVTHAAGENEAMNVLTNEFTVKLPDTYVPELAVSTSPTGEGGSRMSYVRFEDSADGVKVFFRDATFTDQYITTLGHGSTHSVKIETTFVKGDDNDVVKLFIDGAEKVRGASWENYYRFDEERNPSTTDRLMWRLNLAPSTQLVADDLHGNGFLFDDVTTTSSHVNNPAPLTPPAPGPAGSKGDNGTNGTNGKDGVNGTRGVDGTNGRNGANGAAGANGLNGVTTYGKLTGATMRTLRAPSIKGMKLVSVRASLRGKRLHTHGRTIKVDLRGKAVGNYNVLIVAKYKTKHGTVRTVRNIRTLSITHS